MRISANFAAELQLDIAAPRMFADVPVDVPCGPSSQVIKIPSFAMHSWRSTVNIYKQDAERLQRPRNWDAISRKRHRNLDEGMSSNCSTRGGMRGRPDICYQHHNLHQPVHVPADDAARSLRFSHDASPFEIDHEPGYEHYQIPFNFQGDYTTTTTTPPWALPPRALSSRGDAINGSGDPPLLPHLGRTRPNDEYPDEDDAHQVIIKKDPQQLASPPNKRRRLSHPRDCFRPDAYRFRGIDWVNADLDCSLPQRHHREWPPLAECVPATSSLPHSTISYRWSSPCDEPSGQLVTAYDSNSSDVFEALLRWGDTIHTTQGEEAACLAFHLWSRVAGIASQNQQPPHSIGSVVAACFWIALKFQESRPFVPKASSMAKVARVSSTDLIRAELAIMARLDWAPLSQWGYWK